MLGSTLRGDEVGDGLRTAKVHLSIEVGSSGILSWGSYTTAVVGESLEQGLLDIFRSVAGDLYDILTSVGAWGREAGDEDFV